MEGSLLKSTNDESLFASAAFLDASSSAALPPPCSAIVECGRRALLGVLLGSTEFLKATSALAHSLDVRMRHGRSRLFSYSKTDKRDPSWEAREN